MDAGIGQLTGRWVAQRPNARRLHHVVLLDNAEESHSVIGRWLCPVKHDRTRPVEEIRFWNLTRNDRPLEAQCPVTYAIASDRLLTIKIGRTVFKERGHVACIT